MQAETIQLILTGNGENYDYSKIFKNLVKTFKSLLPSISYKCVEK